MYNINKIIIHNNIILRSNEIGNNYDHVPK